jgi:replicative DNA helicase
MDKLLEHGMPSDPDSEQSLLGVLLQRPALLDEIDTALPEFYDRHCRLLYEAMLDLKAEGQPIEFGTIRARLHDVGALESIGGATWIASLIDGMPVQNEQWYAERIRSKYLQRRTVQIGNAIMSHALDGEVTGVEAVEYAENAVARLTDESQGVTTGDVRALGEVAAEQVRLLETGAPTDAVGSGLVDLDRVMIGFERETLTIVGARPMNGKTAFGLALALHCALQNLPVAFFSLEMSLATLTQRLLSMRSGVPLQAIRYRQVYGDDLRRVREAQADLAVLPLVIDDTRGLTAQQVCSRLRRYKQQRGVGITFVDYLTRLKFSAKRELRHELGDATKVFKDVSGELDIPVIALSQLSRASVKEGKPRMPQLSDLRESGNIEEDADNVLFIHRDAAYERTDENAALADVIVSKQRQGPAPEFVKVGFQGACVRFENLWRERGLYEQ